MATKVVKSFQEKVINVAIWPESQKNKKKSFEFSNQEAIMNLGSK